MTTTEIKALVAAKLAGQGSAVDLGSALPSVINALCDLVDATDKKLQKAIIPIEVGEGTEFPFSSNEDGLHYIDGRKIEGRLIKESDWIYVPSLSFPYDGYPVNDMVANVITIPDGVEDLHFVPFVAESSVGDDNVLWGFAIIILVIFIINSEEKYLLCNIEV